MWSTWSLLAVAAVVFPMVAVAVLADYLRDFLA
jgi:nitrate reductase NapE component